MARKVYTSEEIGRRMEALPEAAADFLYSSEMGAIITEIASKHSLHIDQTGLLEAEAGQLILGLTQPGEFAPYIVESLKINAEQAAAIASEVNEKIMSKIRASMGQPSGVPVATPPTVSKLVSTPVQEKGTISSVVMPSSSSPITLPIATPRPTPNSTPVLTPISPSAQKPSIAPNLGAADSMLSEKKVTPPTIAATPAAPATAVGVPATPATSPMPKVDPARPQDYKADPYREPVE